MSGVSPSLLGRVVQWSAVAQACPAEAAEVARIKAELASCTNDTPQAQAIALYEQLLIAEAALSEAWTARNLEDHAP